MKTAKKILKWIGFCCLFVALFAFTIIANQKRDQTIVTEVNVDIVNQKTKFLNPSDILKYFEDKKENFGPTDSINLKEIEQMVLANNYVENCEAFINNSEQLTITVNQKEPLFRVFHQNGVSYYVEKNGFKFPISSTFTANVPIATGKIVYSIDSLGQQQGKAINNLITFFNYVNEDESLKALVSSVDVKPNGDFVFSPRTGKHLVNIGQPTNLEDKMNRLKIFYDQGLNKVGWDKYKEVSLKYDNQIIAKKR